MKRCRTFSSFITFTWRKIILLITFLGTFTFLLHENSIKHLANIATAILQQKTITEDITCYSTVSETESILTELNPSEKSIFFHETSCKGYLDSRQACTVESTARAHPTWEIHVLFAAPLNLNFVKQITTTFKDLPSVKFTRILLNKYAEGTPAKKLITDGRLNASLWKYSHTSDILRYLSLYKWGGIYLDLDIIMAKSLEDLSKNWSARESVSAVAAGALAFSRDAIGRQVANAAIGELEASFLGNVWNNNGPGVITRVLKRMCNTSDVSKMSADTCSGFEVYGPSYFYPIQWQHGKAYFDTNTTVPEAYGYHVWNKITHNHRISPNSLYDRLARLYCPSIYANGFT